MSLFREITDRYRIGEVLASGPRGSVLRALDAKTGAAVVVKRLTPAEGAGGAAQRRFARYAGTLSALRHPGLPALLDFGLAADGGGYLVFEPIEGRSFEALAGGAPAEILTLLLQATDALEVLSRHGLAHGNLTLGNLLVTDGPAGEQVKVLGLGTAVFHPAAHPASGDADGSAGPAAGDTADWRSDLHALAGVACHMLGAWVTSPQAAEPELNLPLGVSFELEDADALRQILVRCLRPRPEERPAAWDEVREAFRLALCGPAGQPSFGEKTNPVYFPPELPSEPARAGGAAAPALRFEEAYALPVPPVPSLPSPVPIVPPAPLAMAALEIAETAPAFSEPDPEEAEAEEMLPSLEHFLAEPPDAPPVPQAAPPAPEAPFPTAASSPASRPPGLTVRQALLFGVPAAVLVLAALGTLIWLRERPTGAVAPPVVPTLAPAAGPAPPPLPSWNVHLRDAQTALDAGDDGAARAALAAITPEEAAALTPAEAAARLEIEETLGQTTRQRLAADLRRALRTGNPTLLRTTVRGIAADEAGLLAAEPALRLDLERGRRILDAGQRLQKASKAGDHAQVFALAATLAEIFPRDRSGAKARDRSAAAIETEAERLAQEGQPAAAIERLEALRNAWPDRPGLGERIDGLRARQEDDQRMERVLAGVAAAERRGRPDEALSLLRAATPAAAYRERFRETGERLETDLRQRDQAPPAVALRDGAAAEYEKGATPQIALTVTDDFQVTRVTLHARPEGGTWQELPHRQSGTTYTAEVPPALHQNKTVQFYATATDLSGHTGQLGSADAPRTIKRKKWYQKLRGGGGEGQGPG